MNFEIHENNDNRYWATCVYRHDPHVDKTYEDVELLNFVLDKTKGEYTFKYGVDTNFIKLYGGYKKSGDVVVLSVSKITKSAISGYIFYEHDLPTKYRFVFDTKADAPDKPTDYKTISDITEADVDGWIKLFGVQDEEYLPE